jgi:hypothetical protein
MMLCIYINVKLKFSSVILFIEKLNELINILTYILYTPPLSFTRYRTSFMFLYRYRTTIIIYL